MGNFRLSTQQLFATFTSNMGGDPSKKPSPHHHSFSLEFSLVSSDKL